MNYFLYPFLVIFSLPINIIAIILSPLLPLCAIPKDGWSDNHSYRSIEPRLPDWLNWFMTPDNSLYGDATFQEINGKGYWPSVEWLCRNPCYSFGLKYLTPPYEAKYYGDPTIKDNDNAKEGWCFVKANGLFQLRIVKRIFKSSRCFYINFGWNIMGLVDEGVNPKANPWQATFVFSPRLSGYR